VAARVRIAPEPELIARHDESHGRWEVNDCPPERGIPETNIVDRQMLTPFDNDEVARCIRAHEVMHSKVSPGTHFPEWLKREYATERALRVVEEVRVNNLCNRAGIPVNKFLSDGGEKAGAERIAKLGYWDDAVYSMVAMIDTAGEAEFLKGIKKHQPQWVAPLKAIAKKIRKEFNKVDLRHLAETGNANFDVYPAGFRYTERVACWLDSIAQLDSDDSLEDTPGKGKESPISGDEIDKSDPTYGECGGDDRSSFPYEPAWGQLNPTEADLLKAAPGSISRKRKAAQVGRNPRRIHRMLTDPERRIFDVKARGKGGIVLIDASGSMHFGPDDIQKIMELAPGALVAIYAEDGDGSSGEHNLHVIAKNGKMADEIPRYQTGNNVDLPALKWAIAKRSSNKIPVLWVTDGAVTGVDGNVYSSLGVQCIEFCKRERIIVAEDINEAVRVMGDLKSGRKPRWVWPQVLKNMHLEMTGRSLTRD
jgi:hypothetical protein